MKMSDLDESIEIEAKASSALCKSTRPDSKLGSSQLSSCKSQGYRKRDSGKNYTKGGKTQKVGRKKIKGKKYGGPLKDYS